MDSIHYEALRRLFDTRRLLPWETEHALFIRGELARLEVTDAVSAKNLKEFYDQRMAGYVEEHPEEFPVVVPVKASAPVIEKKKPGKKPKA